MADRILVPYDDSPLSRAALEFCFETYPDAAVTVLYVIPVGEPFWLDAGGPSLPVPVSDRARSYAEEVLDEAERVASGHDRDVDREIAIGKPARRIVTEAEDGEYDAVVVGSHGRPGDSRPLLGSVAETVVRRSPVPVAVVR
ncbi:universal stress protein [Halopiger goleimassiliensis]|uniref:universal stress protein n=1 Tax=Halopiger goleimassiliensis TaxID=1293048 RepID=UPI0006778B9C|nr:universal stress protein [Halopiger goleimassiliensis]